MGRKFNKLEKKVQIEYLKKGYSLSKAVHIANATAGKVYREQLANCHKCGKASMETKHGLLSKTHHCHSCGYRHTSY